MIRSIRVETRVDEGENVVVILNGWELPSRIPPPGNNLEYRISEAIRQAYAAGALDGRMEVRDAMRAVIEAKD